MSDVNLVFTVNSVSSTFTVDTTTVNVTPNTTAINMFAGYAAYPPNGATGNSQVLFNDAGLFGGDSGFTYDKSLHKVTLANLDITANSTITNLIVSGNTNLGPISKVKITGGADGQYLQTDGSGNLKYATLVPGGLSGQLQFNNANTFGGMPNVTYNAGVLSLGNTSNVKMSGGTNGLFLQTDGLGNLTWSETPGGSNSATVAGSNTQVQYNIAGGFSASPYFTYNPSSNTLTTMNSTSNTLSVTGNATFTGTTRIQQGAEKADISASSLSGTVNWDVLDGAIKYYTSSIGGNITLNFRGNANVALGAVLNVGESLTVALLSTVGSTSYMPTEIQIDGVTQSVKYSGNIPPSNSTVSANSVTSYNYTFLKTGASSYLSLGTYSSY